MSEIRLTGAGGILALVVRQELWQLEPDLWHAHSRNEDLEDALMRAVFTMVEGGING